MKVINISLGTIEEAKRLVQFFELEQSRLREEGNKYKALSQQSFSEAEKIQEQLNEIRRQVDFSDGHDKMEQVVNNIIEEIKNSDVYDHTWSIPDKASFVFKTVQRILTIKELVREIGKLESIKDEEKMIRNFSSALGTKAKSGKMFGRVKITKDGEFKYGLKNWFDEDGKLSSEYNSQNIIKKRQITENPRVLAGILRT